MLRPDNSKYNFLTSYLLLITHTLVHVFLGKNVYACTQMCRSMFVFPLSDIRCISVYCYLTGTCHQLDGEFQAFVCHHRQFQNRRKQVSETGSYCCVYGTDTNYMHVLEHVKTCTYVTCSPTFITSFWMSSRALAHMD